MWADLKKTSLDEGNYCHWLVSCDDKKLGWKSCLMDRNFIDGRRFFCDLAFQKIVLFWNDVSKSENLNKELTELLFYDTLNHRMKCKVFETVKWGKRENCSFHMSFEGAGFPHNIGMVYCVMRPYASPVASNNLIWETIRLLKNICGACIITADLRF